MTSREEVERRFPIGTRFYSFGMDSMFTVERIEDDFVIAWMDHDAIMRDRAIARGEDPKDNFAWPTQLGFDYMLNPERAIREDEWSSLTDEQRQAEWNRVWNS